MTHIAILIPTLDQVAGAERQILTLAPALAQRGHPVTLVALSGTAENHRAALAASGVSILCLHMRKAWLDPRGWLTFLRWHRQNRPHILHAHLPHAIFFARLVRLIAPARVVLSTVHTTALGSGIQQFLFRATGPLSTHLTAVSHAAHIALLRAGLASPTSSSLLPNAIPVSTTDPTQAAVNGTFHWLAIGRLIPLKDYPTLLRAFAQLPSNSHLTIAGSGPELATLQQLAHELNITPRVHFLGFVPDLELQFRTAHACVLSSLWEGLPLAPLEAAAHALPVVATNAPGTAETLIPNRTGFLVPVANPDALAAAMRRLMHLPQPDRLAMGNAAHAFALKQFALPVILDRWQSLYASLLAANPRPSRLG